MGLAGFRAGLLTSIFAAEHGRSYGAPAVVGRLREHPQHPASAERLITPDFHKDWRLLLRSIQRGDS